MTPPPPCEDVFGSSEERRWERFNYIFCLIERRGGERMDFNGGELIHCRR
jgi:hypothetical protein